MAPLTITIGKIYEKSKGLVKEGHIRVRGVWYDLVMVNGAVEEVYKGGDTDRNAACSYQDVSAVSVPC